MRSNIDIELVREYNKINNSYKSKCIYHVGCSAGFHSEVDAMMQCMLYCYVNKIKFVLYADDANFATEGYEEFFLPFCEMNHSRLNSKYNDRYDYYHGKIYNFFNFILRRKEHAKFLTADIFSKCIPREYSENTYVKWDLFGINGPCLLEFGKLAKIALRYNDITQNEVDKIIKSVGLPHSYSSVQLRGGDKILEFPQLNIISDVAKNIRESGKPYENLFVFSDEYDYVEEIKKLLPESNIYSLTQNTEHGYNNASFNILRGTEKHKQMIKLFAMIDICMASDVHFGNEMTCVNNYIRSVKEKSQYYPVVRE